VSTPPTTGPSTEEIPKAIPNIDVKVGILRRGTSGIMIIMPPEKIPAEPRPAIARPKMKLAEFGAAPHRAEPTSKTTTDVRKTVFVEYSR